MRIVVQRVKSASVSIENKTVGEIAGGLLVLLGITNGDTEKDADWLVEKILKLRLFAESENSDSFMEKNVAEFGGSVLVVSQFTLYGDCRKGTKPSFTDAARPELAEPLYRYFVEKLRSAGVEAPTGTFGAHMAVSLINDGPVTLIIDSPPRGNGLT